MPVTSNEVGFAITLQNDPTTLRPNRETIPFELRDSGLLRNQGLPRPFVNELFYRQGQAILTVQSEYQAADTTLQDNIDTVANNLSQEVTDRESGDTSLQSQIDALTIALTNLQDKVIPKVGDTWITKSTEAPSTRFGVGTWSLIEGRMLVGIDTGDTDFDTIGEQGGSKSHTHTDTLSVQGTALTEGQLPVVTHSHDYVDRYHAEDATNIPAATSTESMPLNYNNSYGGQGTDTDNDTWLTYPSTTDTTSFGNGETHTHGLSGSVTSANSMNPYHVVYIWERTA